MTRLSMQQGLTLVELMISLVLALVLLAASTSVYLSNKISYQTTDALSRLQENGQFATYYLSSSLKEAGYYGCVDVAVLTPNNRITDNSVAFNNMTSVSGYDGSGGTFSPALPAAITGSPVNNSDVVSIHTTSNKIMFPSSTMNSKASSISINNFLNLTAGKAILITNCSDADLFMASAGTNANTITHTTDYNQNSSLSTTYDTTSEVRAFQYFAYYVRDTGRLNSLNQPIYALVSEDAYHNINEVAEGVEQMKVVYAVNTDATPGPNSYQTANQVNTSNNWDNVVGIQISLLLSSIENVTQSPQNYYFNGVTYTPTDHKLRKQWDVFISLSSKEAVL